MISTASGKQCTKCGEVKSMVEFNRHVQRPDGTWRLKTRCKACSDSNSARNRAERKGIQYKPQSKCDQCGKLKKVLREGVCLECKPRERELSDQWASIRAFDAAGLGEWRRSLAKANTQARSRLVQRMADRCPWHRKFSAICAGLRHRTRDEKKKASPSRRMQANDGLTSRFVIGRTDWGMAFKKAIARSVVLCQSRRKYRDDPWYAKFASTTRNWRRKLGDGRHQVAVFVAGEARRQVCFDWT